jgi:hypothetical protein
MLAIGRFWQGRSAVLVRAPAELRGNAGRTCRQPGAVPAEAHLMLLQAMQDAL